MTQSLNELNHWQQLAFSTALCQRALPNYQLFCEIEGWDEQAKSAHKILNKVWEYLRGQLKSLKNMEKQLELIPDLIPEPEEFENYGAYPAMDVAVNLQSCVQSILDSSIEDASAIQTMTQSRLEEVLELQGIEKADSELWQRQLDFEQAVVEMITAHGSHAEMIKQLIPLSRDGDTSQLGICLSQ